MFAIFLCMAIGHVFGDLQRIEIGKDDLKAIEDAREDLPHYVKEAINHDQYLQSKDNQVPTQSVNSIEPKTDEKPSSLVQEPPLTSGAYEARNSGQKVYFETREEDIIRSLLKYSNRNTSSKKDSMMFRSFPVKSAAFRYYTDKDLSIKMKSFRRKRDAFDSLNDLLEPVFGVLHPKAKQHRVKHHRHKVHNNIDYTKKEKLLDVDTSHQQETNPMIISRSGSPKISAASYSAMQYLLNKLPDVLKSKILITDDAEKVVLENYVKSQSVPTEVLDAYNSAKKDERELLKRLLKEISTYRALRKSKAWNNTRLQGKFMRFLHHPSTSLEKFEALKRNEFTSLDSFRAYNSGQIIVPEGTTENTMSVEADTQKLRESEKVKVGGVKMAVAMEAERRMKKENEMADEAEIRTKREIETEGDEEEDTADDDESEETEADDDGDDKEEDEEPENEDEDEESDTEQDESEEDEDREETNRGKERKNKKKHKAKKHKPAKAEAETPKQVNVKHSNRPGDEKKAQKAEKQGKGDIKNAGKTENPENKSKLNDAIKQKTDEKAKGLNAVEVENDGKVKPNDGNETKTQETKEGSKTNTQKTNEGNKTKTQETKEGNNTKTQETKEGNKTETQETKEGNQTKIQETKEGNQTKTKETKEGNQTKTKETAVKPNLVKPSKAEEAEIKALETGSNREANKAEKRIKAEAKSEEIEIGSRTKEEGRVDKKQGKGRKAKRKRKHKYAKKRKSHRKTAAQQAENKETVLTSGNEAAEIETEIKAEAESKGDETEDDEKAEDIEKEIKEEAEQKGDETEDDDEESEEIEKEIKEEAEHREIQVGSEDEDEDSEDEGKTRDDDTENERVEADTVQAYKFSDGKQAQVKHTGGRKIKSKVHAKKAEKHAFENVGRKRKRIGKDTS